MIVLDPVTMGDATFSRASPRWAYDKTGTLVEVPVNVPAVTYDPADLSAAPYVLVEPATTNRLRYSGDFANAAWAKDAGVTAAASSESAPDGSAAWILTDASATGYQISQTVIVPNDMARYTFLVRVLKDSDGTRCPEFLIRMSGGTAASEAYLNVDTRTGATSIRFSTGGEICKVQDCASYWLISVSVANNGTGNTNLLVGVRPAMLSAIGGPAQIAEIGSIVAWGAMLADGDYTGSYIPTSGVAVTHAADGVGATAGLLYSNVLEPEPLWVAGTYAKGAKVRNEAHIVFQSLADANAAPLTDASKWLKLGATNRHAMFDDRNNTQTANGEEIVVALSPRAIAQGLFLGNVDASEIGIAVTVPNFGVVYRETVSLVVSTSSSSFFRWAFNRIRRKTSFLSLKLPIFFNGVVTVTIRRPGGIAKCGMCMIGPTVEPGPTLMGLSTEIKDYSTTSFNVDGSSSTIERGYRKLMSMDVSIATENIEQAEDQMIAWRQKTAVWIGAASRPDSIICGRYSSFKKVIESYPRSKMALQIEGVLS